MLQLLHPLPLLTPTPLLPL
jgi:hypothetical protein